MLRSKLVPATALAVLSLGFGTVEGPSCRQRCHSRKGWDPDDSGPKRHLQP